MLREMKQLETIMSNLVNDQYYAVSITDGMTARPICKNMLGVDMVKSKESVEAFFNDLFDKGVQRMIIQPRRKNGNNFRDYGNAETVTIAPIEAPQPVQVVNTPVYSPTHQPNMAQHDNTGLMGGIPGLMGGLNAVDLAYRYRDYDRVIADNARLVAENDSYKKEVATLEKEAMKNEFSAAKSEGNKEMLNGLIQNLPLLLPALGLGGAAGPVPGGELNAPAPAAHSEAKRRLIQGVMETQDYIADYLTATLNGLYHNQEFAAEFFELLAKHNLIQKPDA